jgi:hypothetical protein
MQSASPASIVVLFTLMFNILKLDNNYLQRHQGNSWLSKFSVVFAILKIPFGNSAVSRTFLSVMLFLAFVMSTISSSSG